MTSNNRKILTIKLTLPILYPSPHPPRGEREAGDEEKWRGGNDPSLALILGRIVFSFSHNSVKKFLGKKLTIYFTKSFMGEKQATRVGD